ncbi:uncharacterized protein LOC121739507 isoform X3 [Aricia agestis]|uniref:uncharacterized protein LOC121739507 isoform X3 n=1 Tax=Aricia agestis TaxID=91739 RepID=UPI001C20BB0C|nr:uncharacterized protein LOC121739507 isoform X3 [Aricia agestis]
MQENNNFETVISKWRRISDVEKIEKAGKVERKENLMAISMPGESNHAPYLDHKKEETSLIVPESKASTSVAVIGAGAATATELSSDKTRTEEKQDLIKHEEESKDAAGDHDKTDDYLDNDKVIVNAPKHTNEKPGDNVDSVFLRPPPPHKRRPSPPANEEEEDCGIKCLYYTLQCCDCVLM